MSGVGVSGLLANLPGTVTPYPVLDYSLGLGGFRTVADNTARDAIGSQFRVEGMLVYSVKTQCYYELQADLTTWVLFSSNGNLRKQTTWFVATTGNDNNDGKTSGTALATVEELSARLCPYFREIIFPQNVTITIGAGTFGSLELNYDFPANTTVAQFGLSILGNKTQSANITLSTVTNTVPAAAGGVRGQITTLAGTFVAHQRISSPPNALVTFVGKLAYSTGLNANAQNTFVSEWMDVSNGHTATVAPGATCAVDALNTTLKNLVLRQGRTLGFGYVQDLIIQGGDCQSPYRNDLPGFMLQFFGCELSGDWTNPTFDTFACYVRTRWNCQGGYWRAYGLGVAALLLSYANNNMEWRQACYFDGGQTQLDTGGKWSNPTTVGNVEFCNGTAITAIDVGVGSVVQSSGGIFWGASTNYAIGVAVASNSGFYLDAANKLAIPATQQLSVSGHNKNYADIPFSIPRALCAVGLNPDPTAAVNTT